jgi:hypothetical protein
MEGDAMTLVSIGAKTFNLDAMSHFEIKGPDGLSLVLYQGIDEQTSITIGGETAAALIKFLRSKSKRLDAGAKASKKVSFSDLQSRKSRGR